MLVSDAPKPQKLEALDVVRDKGNRDALSVLQAAINSASDPEIKAAATTAAAAVRQSLAAWEAAQNVWYGISLGSVLLLAALIGAAFLSRPDRGTPEKDDMQEGKG